jgi:hypothetical protein
MTMIAISAKASRIVGWKRDPKAVIPERVCQAVGSEN